jgi:hypothetical protein
MRLLRHRIILDPRLRRRWTGALLLVAYVLTVAGIPLPAGTPANNPEELFPCAHSSCGCQSAERCWRSCCCHTLAERLAWARKRGVRPPAFAVAQAQLAGLDVDGLKQSADQVCASNQRSCCDAKVLVQLPSCCKVTTTAADDTRESCSHHRDVPVNEAGGFQIVVWQAMKCRGQSLNWLSTSPALIEVAIVPSHEMPLVAWLGAPSSDTAEALSPTPAPPPPERA